MDPITFHKESIRAHAAKRFRERYGQELTSKLRSGFHRQIEQGRTAWLIAVSIDYKYGGTCEVYFVSDRSIALEPIVLVFRRDWMEIVTFMTPAYWRAQITGELAEERRRRDRFVSAQDYYGAPDLRKKENTAS